MSTQMDTFSQLFEIARDKLLSAEHDFNVATELLPEIKRRFREQDAVASVTSVKPRTLSPEELHRLSAASIAAMTRQQLSNQQLHLLVRIAQNRIREGQEIIRFVADRLPDTELWTRTLCDSLEMVDTGKGTPDPEITTIETLKAAIERMPGT